MSIFATRGATGIVLKKGWVLLRRRFVDPIAGVDFDEAGNESLVPVTWYDCKSLVLTCLRFVDSSILAADDLRLVGTLSSSLSSSLWDVPSSPSGTMFAKLGGCSNNCTYSY